MDPPPVYLTRVVKIISHTGIFSTCLDISAFDTALSAFWRPIHFSAQCRLLWDQSVCPFVCMSVTSRTTVKTVWDRPMEWAAYKKAPPGYSGDPSQTLRPPLPANWGLTAPSRNLHRKLRSNSVWVKSRSLKPQLWAGGIHPLCQPPGVGNR